jgi:hypothetical protein
MLLRRTQLCAVGISVCVRICPGNQTCSFTPSRISDKETEGIPVTSLRCSALISVTCLLCVACKTYTRSFNSHFQLRLLFSGAARVPRMEQTVKWAPRRMYLVRQQKLIKTPWPESASELYRQSDLRLSAKLVQTFADRRLV